MRSFDGKAVVIIAPTGTVIRVMIPYLENGEQLLHCKIITLHYVRKKTKQCVIAGLSERTKIFPLFSPTFVTLCRCLTLFVE